MRVPRYRGNSNMNPHGLAVSVFAQCEIGYVSKTWYLYILAESCLARFITNGSIMMHITSSMNLHVDYHSVKSYYYMRALRRHHVKFNT